MNKFLSLKRRISNDQAPIIVKETSTIKMKPKICIGRIQYVLVTRLPVLGKCKINLRRKAKPKILPKRYLYEDMGLPKPVRPDISSKTKTSGHNSCWIWFLLCWVSALLCSNISLLCPISPFVIRMFVYYILCWNHSSWILYC